MRDIRSNRVDRQFTDRWSTRQYHPDPVDPDDLQALFEAARWAPSCFNAQPWLFVYSASLDERDQIASVVNERNAAWAAQAPHLAVLFARRRFEHNERENKWAAFDTGAAWMSLALQAHLLHLNTHAMGGFDAEKAYTVSGVDPADYEVQCVIAIGRPAEQEEEPRTPRKDPQTVIKQLNAS